jgi:hypothetical protein
VDGNTHRRSCGAISRCVAVGEEDRSGHKAQPEPVNATILAPIPPPKFVIGRSES